MTAEDGVKILKGNPSIWILDGSASSHHGVVAWWDVIMLD